MSEPLGIAAPKISAAAIVQAATAALQVELLTPPPALQAAASFVATVIGRGTDGAVMLSSTYGTLALKTTLPLPAGARVDLRVQPGNPPGVIVLAITPESAPETTPPAPPMQLDLGSTVAATVIAAPEGGDGLPEGTHLLLRLVAPPLAANSPPAPAATPSSPNSAAAAPQPEAVTPAPAATMRTLVGTIALAAATGADTVMTTPIGTLALATRIALPAGTAIAFERLGEVRPAVMSATPPLAQANGWPALDQALLVLERAAPDVAQLLHDSLAPRAAPALAGALLFLAAALNRGDWPGAVVAAALSASGQEPLRQRLGEDVAELVRLGGNAATGDWQVLMLPLLAGATVQPLRLFLRRRGGQTEGQPSGGTRFIIEVELSRLGPLQLDSLVRDRRLDVVLRSHHPLARELRAETSAVFHRASDASGFHGDIVFATAAQFSVAPLAALRRHVAVQV